MAYKLDLWDESGGDETVEFDDLPDEHDIRCECEAYVANGDWGRDGASIDVYWTVTDEEDNEIDSGTETVDVEPDHESLIREVVGVNLDDICGTAPDSHDWTSEGEGGCDDNPGVWSTGGTSMTFRSHCRVCGLVRIEHHTGSQRNPGEHDEVEYRLPE